MSFVNRLAAILNGFGTGIQNDTLFLSAGNSLSTTNAQTTTLSGLTPTLSKGLVRLKFYGAGGTTPVVNVVQVIVTDGTTYVTIFVGAAYPTMSTVSATGSPYTNGGSNSAVGGVDIVIPFEVDINCTAVAVLTTLTGTNPTAKLDVEVQGTV